MGGFFLIRIFRCISPAHIQKEKDFCHVKIKIFIEGKTLENTAIYVVHIAIRYHSIRNYLV